MLAGIAARLRRGLSLPSALLRCRSGAALVDFALAAPFVILLSLGTLDLGRAVWLDVTLEHAAKEAARFASLRGSQSLSPVTESDVEAFVRNRAVGVPPADLQVSVVWSPNNNSGGTVRIDLAYSYDLLIAGFIPVGPLQLEGSATMTVL